MTSLWLDRSRPVADDALPDEDAPLDVVVVGAGLTGLTTALLLARGGLRVACVEARTIGAVTTGRTTGKVSLLQGTHLSRIRRHQSEAAEGHTFLLAYAPSDLDTQRLMNVAGRVGYNAAHKYDRFTITKL